MQLKLETNLPVIFLTLLVIAIVVLGYLELKKIQERLKMLEYANKEKKEIINDNEKVETETIEEIKKDVSPLNGNNNRVEEWQINNDKENMVKENIINTLNNKEEYSEEVDEENEKLMFNGGLYGPPPDVFKMMDGDDDDIIDRISKDEYVDFEHSENQMFDEITNENDEHDENDENDENGGGDVSEGNGENYGEETPKEDNSEASEESIEDINLKELSDEEDFSKTKIIVDETKSVNELKVICKNLGIQLSGNKTTLIKRIMDNQ